MDEEKNVFKEADIYMERAALEQIKILNEANKRIILSTGDSMISLQKNIELMLRLYEIF